MNRRAYGSGSLLVKTRADGTRAKDKNPIVKPSGVVLAFVGKGAVSGAVVGGATGAVIGGPVGLVIGGVTGAVIGDNVSGRDCFVDARGRQFCR